MRLTSAFVTPVVCSLLTQVLYPFIDPITRSKAEFVNTKDFHAPAKSGGSHSSTWGAWASSVFHAKSSCGSGSGSGKISAGPQVHPHEDAAMVVSDGKQEDNCESSIAVKGSGTFTPFLKMYETPFCFDRHQQLLTACGW